MSDKKAVHSQRQYTGFDESQARHATFAQFDVGLSTMSVDNLAVFVIFALSGRPEHPQGVSGSLAMRI